MKESGANKILVVEDDSTVRGYLATILTDDGFSVTTRSSGKAAKALLKKDAFDLVLTDLIMPEFSGLDLLKFIRKNKINSEVIILTAFSDMDSVLGALRSGADDFLIKPCDRLVLHKAITRAFRKINLEREKERSDQKYHKLFESTNDMVFMLGLKGIVTEMNSRGFEIFGRTRGQIIGKSYKRLINKDDYQEAVQAFEKTMDGQTMQFVARIRPKDNSLWYFEFTYSPLYSEGQIQGVYCIAHDITQLKQLQNQLEEYSHNLEKIVEERTADLKASEERLRALTAVAKEGVITADSTGKITFANPAAASILGCDPENLIGKPVETVVPPEIQESKKSPLKAFLKHGKEIPKDMTLRVNARKNSGGDLPAEISISSFRLDNEVFATILLRDLTSPAEARGLTPDCLKTENVGKLAGGIAHNLNNLLCGILGYTSFLKSTTERGTELHRCLAIIEDSCTEAGNLTRQVVELAEVGEHQVELCDPKRLVDETVRFLRRSFPTNISIKSTIEPSAKNIMCDISRLRQVLLCLSMKAKEAMPNGGTLSLEVKDTSVGARLVKKHPHLQPGVYSAIAVRHTGDGIDQEGIEQTSEGFCPTELSGHEMDLSSSFEIIKAHNGVIDVELRRGKGTVFTIYVPAADERLPKEIDPGQNEMRSGSETILVVDDEKVFTDLARDVLEKSGFKVITVGTGGEGVEAFKKHRKDIDLVLLDLMLPDMDCDDVLKAIRAIDPETRFAITSGYSFQNLSEELRSCVDGGFLKKPCTAERMTEVVRMALDKKS